MTYEEWVRLAEMPAELWDTLTEEQRMNGVPHECVPRSRRVDYDITEAKMREIVRTGKRYAKGRYNAKVEVERRPGKEWPKVESTWVGPTTIYSETNERTRSAERLTQRLRWVSWRYGEHTVVVFDGKTTPETLMQQLGWLEEAATELRTKKRLGDKSVSELRRHLVGLFENTKKLATVLGAAVPPYSDEVMAQLGLAKLTEGM